MLLVESATILSILYSRFIEVWRQKEAIVQKNRMTRLLIRNAGHEVRTPLNSIINYLEVALEETLDEPARHHLQKSLQASKSLVFVVNDLLNLTEAEDADFSAHEDNVELRDVLSEVISAFETESAKRNIQVVLEEYISNPWIVICDPIGLRTVVSNLLANAIKHSTGGVVRIIMDEAKTTKASSFIAISFQDEGEGLSEEQLNSIFQDFERILDDEESPAQSTESTGSTGSRNSEIGLGLAVTARFVRLNNGQISISSEGKGRGTTVSITLPFRKALPRHFGKRKLSHSVALPTPPTDLNPIHPQNTSEQLLTESPSTALSTPEGSAAKGKLLDTTTSNPATPDATSTTPSSSASIMSPVSAEVGRFPFPVLSTHQEQKFSILVAEDNPLNSQLLETRLRRRGHEVKVAVNGYDCVDIFSKTPAAFDLILMDIQVSSVQD